MLGDWTEHTARGSEPVRGVAGPPWTRWPSWWEAVQSTSLENEVCTGWPGAGPMYLPWLPSPCSLSSINISTFRMKQIYLTFKGMIFSFQNKKACAVSNLGSRNPGGGRPGVPNFLAKVPVYAHKARNNVPDVAAAFGSDGFWLLDLPGD